MVYLDPVGGFIGTPSIFSTVTSQGGGGGGGFKTGTPKQLGAPGGSGGGAGDFYGSSTGDGSGNKDPANQDVPNQGYPGGHGNYPGSPNENYGGGGGGGAGGIGGNGQDPSTGGVGGNGKASVISEGPGNPITRAGGGGGGIQDPGGTLGVVDLVAVVLAESTILLLLQQALLEPVAEVVEVEQMVATDLVVLVVLV